MTMDNVNVLSNKNVTKKWELEIEGRECALIVDWNDR